MEEDRGLTPRVVIGVPTFNGERHVREALESLLAQRFESYRVLVLDDGSSDATTTIVQEYADRDTRLTFERNDTRLGMIQNCCRLYVRARELFGPFELFAWGSDHDAWHPRWLPALVAALDGDQEAVLAYPLVAGIDDDGGPVKRPWHFETAAVTDVDQRLSKAMNGMVAGSMLYGLYKADALERCGIYHRVLWPDRLLLAQLACHGTFVQKKEILWYRRYRAGVAWSNARQRRSFFPQQAPIYSYLPWWSQHAAVFSWSLLRGGARPAGVTTPGAGKLAMRHLALTLGYSQRRTRRRSARLLRRRATEARRAVRACRTRLRQAAR